MEDKGPSGTYPLRCPLLPPPSGIAESNDYSECVGGGGDPTEWHCNCDMAMYPFEAVYSTVSGGVSGSLITWTSGNWTSEFNSAKATLTTTHNTGSGTVKYICRFHDYDHAEEAFLSLVSNTLTPPKQYPTLTGEDITLPADENVISSGNHFEYSFKEAGGLPVMKYVSINSPEQDRYIFYEFPDNPYQSFRIDTTRCYTRHPYMDEDELEFGYTGATPPEPVPDVDPTVHFNRNPSTALIAPKETRHDKAEISFMQNKDMFLIKDNSIAPATGGEPQKQLKTIVVYDLLGREVYSTQTDQNHYSIQTANFASGTYVVKVIKDGRVSGHKLFVY